MMEKEMGIYKDGHKHEEWIYYSPTGIINYKMNYKEGLQEGVCEFYYKNGHPYVFGEYKNGNKHGKWQYFNKAGQPSMIINFDNGLKNDTLFRFHPNGQVKEQFIFANDTLTSIGLTYYKDGSLKDSVYYDAGKLQRYVCFSRKGKPMDAGTYENGNGIIKTYNDKEVLLLEIAVEDYKAHGPCKAYKAGETKEHINFGDKEYTTAKFIKGSKQSGRLFRLFPLEITLDGVWVIVDEMPSYMGGQAALFQFIHKQVSNKYPLEAKKQNIRGTVYVGFHLNDLGFVENVEIKRGLHELLDPIAMEIVKDLPRWQPGFEDGMPITIAFTLPIKFD